MIDETIRLITTTILKTAKKKLITYQSSSQILNYSYSFFITLLIKKRAIIRSLFFII